jgi:hypothetical protein
MFPVAQVQTNDKITAAQAMEDDIALQESKAGAHRKRMEALQVKFAAAVELKSMSKEKGVSWSSQEPHPDKGSFDDGVEAPVTDSVLAENLSQPKQGSNYRKSSKLSRLASQASVQDHLAAHPAPPACSPSTQKHRHPASSASTQEDILQGGAVNSLTTAQGTPLCDGAQAKSTLFSDLAILRQDALTCASSVDSVLGLTEVTPAGAPASDRPSALNLSNYPYFPHN